MSHRGDRGIHPAMLAAIRAGRPIEIHTSEISPEETARRAASVIARGDRVVVSWIPIETRHACQVCQAPAAWEEVRAVGPDGMPIDMGRPRLRCDEHFPASTTEVDHRKETT